MRRLLFPLLTIAIVGAGAALAQNAAPSPAAPAPVPMAATPAPMAASAAGPNASAAACRAQVDGKSLTGPERKAEMQACMRTRREACARTAGDQHIPERAGERRDFVRKCMQQGGAG